MKISAKRCVSDGPGSVCLNHRNYKINGSAALSENRRFNNIFYSRIAGYIIYNTMRWSRGRWSPTTTADAIIMIIYLHTVRKRSNEVKRNTRYINRFISAKTATTATRRRELSQHGCKRFRLRPASHTSPRPRPGNRIYIIYLYIMTVDSSCWLPVEIIVKISAHRRTFPPGISTDVNHGRRA